MVARCLGVQTLPVGRLIARQAGTSIEGRRGMCRVRRTIDEEGKGEQGDVDDGDVGPGGDVGAAQAAVGCVDAHSQRDEEGVEVDVGA